MHRLLALFAILLAAAPAWGDSPSARASHVWIRQAPPGVKVLAAYLNLENLSDAPLSLDSVNSPDFDSVMVHQSVVKDGVESMVPVDKLSIPAKGRVELKPGGYHLMLMQPKKNLFAGDTVTLMLRFSDGSELAILAPVRRDPPAQ